MQKKILVVASLILTLTVIAAGAALSGFSDIRASDIQKDKMSGLEMLDYYTQQATVEEVTFPQQLRLELPEGMGAEDIIITNQYIRQLITIKLPGVEENYFEKHPLLGKSSHINDLYMENGVIDITLDAVYELVSSVEEGYLYLDFKTPQEVYSKVVVIDAGHGGSEPGAIKQDIMEKDINIAIVNKLKAILDTNDQNIGVYYTRTDDSCPTFEQRAQLANKSNADMFISIHNNSTKDEKLKDYSGTEVMFDEQKSEEGLSGKRLAQICLEETTGILGSRNNGLSLGHSIYIIRNSQVPVALVEVGFMTNQAELSNLLSEEYQQQAAQGIYNAIIRAIQEGY